MDRDKAYGRERHLGGGNEYHCFRRVEYEVTAGPTNRSPLEMKDWTLRGGKGGFSLSLFMPFVLLLN